MHAALAAAPILFLFWALAVRRWRGPAAAGSALLLALPIATLAFGMPLPLALLSAAHGLAFAVWPVAGIIAAAIVLYELVVVTGELEVVKAALASVTPDRRLQALLVAFVLEALLEGAAGFGTPLAIGGAMLAALGFPAVTAAATALAGNTAGVGFGALGIGMEVASRVSGLDVRLVSAASGRMVPLLTGLVPFVLVTLVAGFRRGLQAWPAALATGVAFAATQGLSLNLLGPHLADVAAAGAALLALLGVLRVWRPREPFRFEGDPPAAAPPPLPPLRVLRAFTPFALLAVAVAAWSLAPVRALLDAATVVLPIPALHGAAFGGHPPLEALVRLDLLSASGTAVLAALAASIPALGAGPRDVAVVLRRAGPALARPLLTISTVLAFAFLMRSSGMAAALGEVIAAASGRAFAAVSPLIGAVGLLLTGAINASNALFVPLQQVSAQRVGLEPLVAIAANVAGGVCTHMIAPQSMAIAAAGLPEIAGREGEVLLRTAPRALALLLGACVAWAILGAPFAAGLLPRAAAAELAPAPAGSAAGWALLAAAGAVGGLLAVLARRGGRPLAPPSSRPPDDGAPPP